MRRIYLASSWRNAFQPVVLDALRKHGHEVYDFRNPGPGQHGFQWSEIDPSWERWTVRGCLEAIQDPIAERGFANDWGAMQWADTGVLLLPSGRPAHIEAGYFVGSGKPLHILMLERQEPELMYLMATSICQALTELVHRLADDAGAAVPS